METFAVRVLILLDELLQEQAEAIGGQDREEHLALINLPVAVKREVLVSQSSGGGRRGPQGRRPSRTILSALS